MGYDPAVLPVEERLSLELRSLYHSKGCRLSRMSKFEEYDFYARNKDFLMSDSVITFTDVGGKLMALRPDVTLSIVRGSGDALPGLRKLFYHENIYRPSDHGGPFRELPQVGVEFQGAVDRGALRDCLSLAVGSLALLSPEYRLRLSHLDLTARLLDALELSPEDRQRAVICIGAKNRSGLEELCRAAGADGTAIGKLSQLMGFSGPPDSVLPSVRALCPGDAAADELERVTSGLPNISIDFSIAGNLNYYNGIVFEGYVSFAPSRVLSGGQYDGLMRKLGRRDSAVGFAVYLDEIQRLENLGEES